MHTLYRHTILYRYRCMPRAYSCRVVCAAEACSCRPAATVDRVSGYDETRAARNKSIPFTRLIESGFPLCRSASAANGTIT